MRHLPRPNEEIFDTGVTWTPDKTPEALDAAFTEIESALGAGGAGGAIPEYTGSGRLAASEAQVADSDQFLPPSPALGFTIPDGFLWVQDGARFVADEDVFLTGLPAGFTGFVTLHAARDDDTDAIVWTFATASTRGALGSGTLAYIETDADSVTILDATDAQSDVILSLPVSQARQRNIFTRLAALESGGGGGGGTGGPFYTGLGLWLPAPGDARETQTVIAAMLAAHRSEMIDLIENGTEGAMRLPDDLLIEQMVRFAASLSEINPRGVERIEMALSHFGFYGHSQTGAADDEGIYDTPNHVLYTTLQIDNVNRRALP